jgi:signal recognition particle GTPase
MTNVPRSARQQANKALREEELRRAVADGRLIIRSMTAREREQSDARWAAAAAAREKRAKRRHHA